MDLVLPLHPSEEVVPDPLDEGLLRRDLRILSEQALEERGVEVRKDADIDGLEGQCL